MGFYISGRQPALGGRMTAPIVFARFSAPVLVTAAGERVSYRFLNSSLPRSGIRTRAAPMDLPNVSREASHRSPRRSRFAKEHDRFHVEIIARQTIPPAPPQTHRSALAILL